MIFTPSYRKFHAELLDFRDFVTTSIANPTDDLNATLVRATLPLVSHFEGDNAVTVITEEDLELALNLMAALVENKYTEPADKLLPISHCSTDTVFEQMTVQLQEKVVFDVNYGFNGTKVFGEDIMDEQLRGLEAVHETEMTPKAFYRLEQSLAAFETFLGWYPEIGQNPFDSGTITDDYLRLSRMVRGA